MVARISSGKNIRGALNYNEVKTANGHAELILAENYPKERDALNYQEKLQVLQQLAQRNGRTKTNCVHISLNFETNEQIGRETMLAIVLDYMSQVGFSEQPYLVYRHSDAAHPHVHVVTTNIRYDGSRISLHNLGRDLSERAREDIELRYGLVRARGRGGAEQVREELLRLKPGDVTKVIYGRQETKKAITQIVYRAMQTYNVTSLAEWNAVINQFGVTAHRGAERSNTFRHSGLLYAILDQKGNRIGVPVKASALFGQPTLKKLAELFEKNKARRPFLKEQVRKQIQPVLGANLAGSRESFVRALAKRNIQVLFRQSNAGVIYGITYIDHGNRCVFNGSELGKSYSANAILDKYKSSALGTPGLNHPSGRTPERSLLIIRENSSKSPEPNHGLPLFLGSQPLEPLPSVPRRKRKRKDISTEQEQSL